MHQSDPDRNQHTSILVLAGGRGSRMAGKDKGLLPLAGKPCIEYVLAALDIQTDSPVLISANRNREQYRRYGFPVIEDSLPDYPGPLAGFLSALTLIRSRYLLTLPVDAPFLCPDYVSRMHSGIQNLSTRAAVAEYNGQMEPVFSILRRDTRTALQDFLHAGKRSVCEWLTDINARPVDFSDYPQQFINLNTPEDLRRAERRLDEQA